MVSESSSDAGGIRAEPKGDIDDLIFRWEPEEWLVSER